MIRFVNNKSGETVTVRDGQRDAYKSKDGWTERAPTAAAKLDGEDLRQQKIRALSSVELFDFFDKRIKEMEARIVALESARGNSG